MKLIVNPHKIEIDKSPVNEREIDITKCEFEFADEITNDYVKEAYFTFNGTSYKEIIVNNQCAIPSEVLAKKGQVEIGVVAFLIENEEEIKRYNPSPAYFNTWQGSLKDNAENSEPITPSEMEQYEQALNDGLNEINTAVENAEKLDIDVEKVDTTTTVTITKQDGTTKSAEILDGAKGDKGDKGEKGDKGDKGEQGEQGVQGIQGIKGDTGEPFTIKKTYPSVETMNEDFDNMNYGDYVMIASSVEIEDNAKLYTRGESNWIYITDFSGATGIKGEKGDKGEQGVQGIQGIQGIQGEKGDTGATGQDGVSPTATVTETTTGATITITDKNGTTTADIKNGEVTEKQLDVVQSEIDKYKTLSNLLPKVEGEGNPVTLNNTVEGVTMDIIPEGNASQNGTPTPDTPIPIKVVTGEQNAKIGTTNYPLSLGTLELAKIRDYQDYIYGSPNNWYKREYIKKIDMGSIIDWSKNNLTPPGYYVINFLNNYGIKIDSVYSNIFSYSGTAWSDNYKIGITNLGNLWIMPGDSTLTDVNNVPTWLTNKGAILYGILQATIDIPITDTTLIEQLNNLYNATSQDGTTIITCSSASDDNETLQVKASTYKDISTILNPTETAQEL